MSFSRVYNHKTYPTRLIGITDKANGAVLNDEKATRYKIEKEKKNIAKAEAKSQELEIQAEEESSLFKQEKRGLKGKSETIKKEKEKYFKINVHFIPGGLRPSIIEITTLWTMNY